MPSLTPQQVAQMGGLQKVFFIEHAQVLQFPAVTASGHLAGPFGLKPGAMFSLLGGTLYTPNLNADASDTLHGGQFHHVVEGFYAGDAPGAALKLAAMNARRYVVLLRYGNGDTLALGDPLAGLLFSYRFTSGAAPRERKGYTWHFEGTTADAAAFLDAAFPLAIEPVSDDGTVTVLDELGNLLAQAEPGQTVVVQVNGTGGSSGAFDWDRPITSPIPGMQGRTIGGQDLAEGLDKLLFAPVGPGAGASLDPSQFEYTAAETVATSLSWSATKGTKALASVTVNGAKVTGTSGRIALTVPANKGYTATVVATDADGASAQAQAGLSFKQRRHVFALADDLSAQLGNAAALSLAVRAADAGSFADARQLSVAVTAAGQFVHVAYPASWGLPNKIEINGLVNSDFSVYRYLHTNALGYVEAYLLVRSNTRYNTTATLTLS